MSKNSIPWISVDSISKEELESLFIGYGYKPYFVEGSDPVVMHQVMAATLDVVVAEIKAIQHDASSNNAVKRPQWPMIILRTPKGWTGPKEVDGLKTEDSWRSHQVPLSEMAGKPDHVRLLEEWMKSYKPDELFNGSGRLMQEVEEMAPHGVRRMGGESTCKRRGAPQRPEDAGIPSICC